MWKKAKAFYSRSLQAHKKSDRPTFRTAIRETEQALDYILISDVKSTILSLLELLKGLEKKRVSAAEYPGLLVNAQCMTLQNRSQNVTGAEEVQESLALLVKAVLRPLEGKLESDIPSGLMEGIRQLSQFV